MLEIEKSPENKKYRNFHVRLDKLVLLTRGCSILPKDVPRHLEGFGNKEILDQFDKEVAEVLQRGTEINGITYSVDPCSSRDPFDEGSKRVIFGKVVITKKLGEKIEVVEIDESDDDRTKRLKNEARSKEGFSRKTRVQFVLNGKNLGDVKRHPGIINEFTYEHLPSGLLRIIREHTPIILNWYRDVYLSLRPKYVDLNKQANDKLAKKDEKIKITEEKFRKDIERQLKGF